MSIDKSSFKYVENELKNTLPKVRGVATHPEGIQDLEALIEILEKVNCIYTPKLRN